MSDADDRRACAGTARRHDRERFLACLFAVPGRQDALMALLAANHEIAKTAEVVSEPMIGRIRLQWWRESLDGIAAGTPREHPVVRALCTAAVAGLDLAPVRRIIDARERDLEAEPVATLEDLEAQARDTDGALFGLIDAAVGGGTPAWAEQVGTVWAMLGTLRGLPHLIASGRRPLPSALLQENDLSHQKISDLGRSVDLRSVAREIAARARDRLDRAPAPAGAPTVLRLLRARTSDHQAALDRAGLDPFDPSVARSPPGLVWRYAVRAAGYRLGF